MIRKYDDMYSFLNVPNPKKPEGYAGTGVCATNVPRGSGMISELKSFKKYGNFSSVGWGFHPNGF